MLNLAVDQVQKSKTAFVNYDVELAEEIRHNEKRMNAMELSIDRDCENTFALFQPVATDLRFLISMLKINSDIERIGDYAEGLANYVIELPKPIGKDVLEATRIEEMFDITIAMMQNIGKAFEEGNSNLARKVYKKDADLNKINRDSSKTIQQFIKKDLDDIRPLLYLFSGIRKLERIGDHVKNIAEDTIFYIEAEVLKHKSKIKN